MTLFSFVMLAIGTAPGTLLLLLVLFHVARKQKEPADESNRMNKLRMVWWALKHEDEAAELYRRKKDDPQTFELAFPKLRKDEFDQ